MQTDKQNVKIIYCKDEDGNPIYYRDTQKNKKYFCIECGDELIIKDGKIKQKHLSHKSNCQCTSNGESFIHKHYKGEFFVPGMQIETRLGLAEIEEVLQEQPLSVRYNKNWDREIIVDTILVTNLGDVIIEIWNTNGKDWETLLPYYNDIDADICDVFEIKINICVNSPDNLNWISLTNIKNLIKLQNQAKERQKQADEEYYKRCQKLKADIIQAIKNPRKEKCTVYFIPNNGNLLKSETGNTYQLKAVVYLDGKFLIRYLEWRIDNSNVFTNDILKKISETHDDDMFSFKAVVKYIDPELDKPDIVCKMVWAKYMKRCKYMDWGYHTAFNKLNNMAPNKEIARSKYYKYFQFLKEN